MDPPPGTRITETSSRGRGLFAERAFRPGDTIAVFSEPLLMLPKASLIKTVCSHCFLPPPSNPPDSSSHPHPSLPSSSPPSTSSPSSARRGPLRACVQCRSVLYCGKKCQAAGWRAGGHKAECAVLARLRPRIAGRGHGVLPTSVRGAMQVALRLRAAAAAAAGDTALVAAFGEPGGFLSGNLDPDWADRDEWTDLGLQARAVVRYAGFVDVDEPSFTPEEASLMKWVLGVMCKINTNAFTWRTDHASGIAVYGTLSMVNHSCMPNACVVALGQTFVLKAELHIAAGDEIEISYIDNARPLHARRADLKPYRFTCECARCTGNLDVYQVCSAHPDLGMNAFSLQPDLQGLCEAASKAMLPDQEIQRIYDQCHDLCHEPAAPGESRSDRKAALVQRYRLCKPLVDARLWAVEPLPSTLQAIFDLWTEEVAKDGDGNPLEEDGAGNPAEGRDVAARLKKVYSLAIMCLLITQWVPVVLPLPFLHGRSGREIALRNLLADVQELISASELREKCPHKSLVDILTRMDGGAVHEAIEMLAIRWGEYGGQDLQRGLAVAELKAMRAIMDSMDPMYGREEYKDLLQAWEDGSSNPLQDDFVKTVVLKPINDLAAIAVDLIESELVGNGSTGSS